MRKTDKCISEKCFIIHICQILETKMYQILYSKLYPIAIKKEIFVHQ